MKVVAQRVSEASVLVEDVVVAAIGPGLCLLVGIGRDDDRSDVAAAVDKIAHMRVFSDAEGKMNLSLIETERETLVISQFTLLAGLQRGRRPSFTDAAEPTVAASLISEMVSGFEALGIKTGAGIFGAHMKVALINDGPATFVVRIRGGKVL